MNMEEEGNAYTGLDTHAQQVSRKIHMRNKFHVRENIREPEFRIKGAEGCIDVCMYIRVYVRWEVGEKLRCGWSAV